MPLLFSRRGGHGQRVTDAPWTRHLQSCLHSSAPTCRVWLGAPTPDRGLQTLQHRENKLFCNYRLACGEDVGLPSQSPLQTSTMSTVKPIATPWWQMGQSKGLNLCFPHCILALSHVAEDPELRSSVGNHTLCVKEQAGRATFSAD